MPKSFQDQFKDLTGHDPFLWQQDLYKNHFERGDLPKALDIPTGLGKTSVMSLWYLATRNGSSVPKRLVYVVDRRAVVDQATEEAERIKECSQDDTLSISTLRGQHVDNKQWLSDPGQPAIIVGTVDMIGSRLLFSGYGVSRKMRSYHGALLGNNTLIVLDEAHLVPPFEELLKTITQGKKTFGAEDPEHQAIIPTPKLLSLSATGREDQSTVDSSQIFRLSPAHRQDPVVQQRLKAEKHIQVEVGEEKDITSSLVEKALALSTSTQGPRKVLIYCDEKRQALAVKEALDKKCKKEKILAHSELLVGGRRIRERSQLSQWLKDHGFMSTSSRVSLEAPAFLVSTSAGEVGVDMDADHMVCDLVAWERMVQRLGRVNRRGISQATIWVMAAPKKGEKEKEWQARLKRLRAPLEGLRSIEKTHDPAQKPARDGSPGALLELKEQARHQPKLQQDLIDATTKAPLRPALTRALVETLSFTSLKEHTGRPENIQPWLRGWEEEQKPQSTMIWRKHLPTRHRNEEVSTKDIEAFFEAAPPHGSEKLETETHKIVEWIKKRGQKKDFFQEESSSGLCPEEVVAYAFSSAMDLKQVIYGKDLQKVSSKDWIKTREQKRILANLKHNLAGGTLIINQRFGGLSKEGMLDEKTSINSEVQTVDDGEGEWLEASDDAPAVPFRVYEIEAEKITDATKTKQSWQERHRFASAITPEGAVSRWIIIEKYKAHSETEEDRSTGAAQELSEHQAWTERWLKKITQPLGLPPTYVQILSIAARLHDEGKRHPRWQKAFKAPQDGKIYAKTKGPLNVHQLGGYRHEFGSLGYIWKDKDFQKLTPEHQDLVLHLVASHHGWARPIISAEGCDQPPSLLEKRRFNVALRFARLTQRWGPWGLAWWEALLRSADQRASLENQNRDLQEEETTTQADNVIHLPTSTTSPKHPTQEAS